MLALALLALAAAPQMGGEGGFGYGGEGPAQSVLIRNVTMFSQNRGGEDKIVSIVIRDRKLELISPEEVSTDGVEMALDGKGTYLFGTLELNKQPSFMLIKGDPRVDFSLLLDTARASRFAMERGRIVRNGLPRLKTDGAVAPKRSGWLAYTPPPMILPANYRDTHRWNRFDTSWISGIFTGALAMDRVYYTGQDDASRTQVGDLEAEESGASRGLRFGFIGTLNFEQPWVYTIFVASTAFDQGFDPLTTGGLVLFDARLDIPTFGGTTLSLGKQKEPFSMERLMSLLFLPHQERTAYADLLVPSRNVGAVFSGTAFNDYISWAAGAFPASFDAGEGLATSNQYVGRVTWVPWSSPDESNLFHLGTGYRISDIQEGQSSVSPEIFISPEFIDTGLITGDGTETVNLEASWRRGPLWVHSEYMAATVKSPSLDDPVIDGWHVSASYNLTGEMRGYNRRTGLFSPSGVASSVDASGNGAWEIAARYSHTDANDSGLDAGVLDITSVGVNWWLSTAFVVSVNYRWVEFLQGGIDGHSEGLVSRVMLVMD